MKEIIKNSNLLLSDGKKINQIVFKWMAGPQSNGETLLILPGLDESINDYENFLNELIILFPHHSLLAIDLRGQGRTLTLEGKVSSHKIKISDQLLIINSIIKSLPIQKLFIIGLSYGAGIALYAANRLPEVDGIALLAPYISKFKSYNEGLIGEFYSLAHLNPFHKMVSHLTLPLYFQLAKNRGELNQNIDWDASRMDALTKLSTGIMDLDTHKEARKLSHLKNGIHLLIGDQDELVPVRAVEDFYHEVDNENKTINILPGIGHRLLVNHHTICAEWLKKVLF